MRTRSLHSRFGVEVFDVDLREVTAERYYPEIRSLFERHSLLMFRNQQMDEQVHNNVASLFGPLEDRLADKDRTEPRERPPVPVLSNAADDGNGLHAASSLHVLNLVGNQQWHTDITFLHTPALINLITAYVMPSSGGETELVSTRAAWRDLPESLKSRVRDAVFLHSVLPSRLRVDPALVQLDVVNSHSSQAWNAIWPNPVTGEEALYIAGHVYGVRGMPPREAETFVSELIEFCTQPEYVYTHRWRPGDVLIMGRTRHHASWPSLALR